MAGLSIALYGTGHSAAAEALQRPCLVLEVPKLSAGAKTQVVGSFRRPLEHRPIKAAVLATKSTSDRSTANDMWELPQKPGNDASRTLQQCSTQILLRKRGAIIHLEITVGNGSLCGYAEHSAAAKLQEMSIEAESGANPA